MCVWWGGVLKKGDREISSRYFSFFDSTYIYSSISDSVTKPDSLIANMEACRHVQWQPGWKTDANQEEDQSHSLLADLCIYANGQQSHGVCTSTVWPHPGLTL